MEGPRALRALLLGSLVLMAAACTTPQDREEETPEGDGDAIVAAFLETARQEDLTFHVVIDGTIDVTARDSDEEESVEIGAELDVSGDDSVGEVTFDIGVEFSVDVLIVDGEGYTEGPDGEWEAVENFEAQAQAPVNPFVRLEGEGDVEYVGPAGDGLHQLRTDVWMGADVETLEAQGWEDVEFTEHSTDIFVTDDGTPVRMEFMGDATGVYEGEDADVHFDVDYEFSDVGEPVDIPEP